MCDFNNEDFIVVTSITLQNAIKLINDEGFTEIKCNSEWRTSAEMKKQFISVIQAVEPVWSVRKPKVHPAELQGFVKDAFGNYKKHLIRDVWVNI